MENPEESQDVKNADEENKLNVKNPSIFRNLNLI